MDGCTSQTYESTHLVVLFAGSCGRDVVDIPTEACKRMAQQLTQRVQVPCY